MINSMNDTFPIFDEQPNRITYFADRFDIW